MNPSSTSAQINCDAMYELEEMMLEENPLYRKRKRLKKEEQRRKNSQDMDIIPGSREDMLMKIEKDYKLFNREKVWGAMCSRPWTIQLMFTFCWRRPMSTLRLFVSPPWPAKS